MTDASEIPPPDEAGSPEDDWKASAAEFFDARLELFRCEARDAGRNAARRVALVVCVLGAAFLCWALAMAGLVGWIAAGAGWPWYFVALGLAALHLLLAGVALGILRKGSPESFPLSRAELLKDRQWLNRIFHQTPPP